MAFRVGAGCAASGGNCACSGDGCDYDLCVTATLACPTGSPETVTFEFVGPEPSDNTYNVASAGSPRTATKCVNRPAAGAWTVIASAPGYQSRTLNLTVVECESQTVNVTLSPAGKSITFSEYELSCAWEEETPTYPGATYTVYDADDNVVGSDNTGTAGLHSVTVDLDGYDPFDEFYTVLESVCDGLKTITRRFRLDDCMDSLTAVSCQVDGVPIDCGDITFSSPADPLGGTTLRTGYVCACACACPQPRVYSFADDQVGARLVFAEEWSISDFGAPFTALADVPLTFVNAWIGDATWSDDYAITCTDCPSAEGVSVGTDTVAALLVARCDGSKLHLYKYFPYYFRDCGAEITDIVAYPLHAAYLSCEHNSGALWEYIDSLSTEDVCSDSAIALTGTWDTTYVTAHGQWPVGDITTGDWTLTPDVGSIASVGSGPGPVLTADTAEPRLPSLARQARNFVRALIRHAHAGRPVADPGLVAARLAVCRACELYRASDGRCAHRDCGCVLEAKARWLTERCPLGRWPAPQARPAQAPAPGDPAGGTSPPATPR